MIINIIMTQSEIMIQELTKMIHELKELPIDTVICDENFIIKLADNKQSFTSNETLIKLSINVYEPFLEKNLTEKCTKCHRLAQYKNNSDIVCWNHSL
jgi:hypothetical protein